MQRRDFSKLCRSFIDFWDYYEDGKVRLLNLSNFTLKFVLDLEFWLNSLILKVWRCLNSEYCANILPSQDCTEIFVGKKWIIILGEWKFECSMCIKMAYYRGVRSRKAHLLVPWLIVYMLGITRLEFWIFNWYVISLLYISISVNSYFWYPVHSILKFIFWFKIQSLVPILAAWSSLAATWLTRTGTGR